jgi:hypothetical protein
MRAARVALYAVPLLALVACGGDANGPTPSPTPTPCAPTTSVYATRVVESWIPASSLAQDIYNDPGAAVGAPDAGGCGPNNWLGFVSLGFGGHVILDLGGCITDRAGADIRVYQAVSGEPVSVYVSTSANGPFTLLEPFFQACGTHVPGDRVKGYCEFDLASSGVTQARYVRVEDAELYPCPCGTPSEGADIDAVQALSVSSAPP